MHIDERSNQLLEELISNSNVTMKTLESKMIISMFYLRRKEQ